MILSRDEILARLRADLEEMFEIPAERITPEARLYEDLDLSLIHISGARCG